MPSSLAVALAALASLGLWRGVVTGYCSRLGQATASASGVFGKMPSPFIWHGQRHSVRHLLPRAVPRVASRLTMYHGRRRHVRSVVANIPPDWTDDEAKHELTYEIERFIEERVQVADAAIVGLLLDKRKIVDGDVILTYARSHVVEQAIKAAHDRGIKFRVIIADARPLLEGKGLLQRLENHGVSCTYVWLNALTYVMKVGLCAQ